MRFVYEFSNISFRDKQEANTPGSETKLYNVQQYNEKSIQIQVSYENKSCYRVYNHVPKGIEGNGTGFRLGNIIFNSFRSDKPITTSNDPLKSVSVYYNTYDTSHKYPLLVILNIGNSGYNTTEYYKLNNKDIYEWVKMSNASDEYFISMLKKLESDSETELSGDKKKEKDETIEEKIDEIRESLNITFTEEQKKLHLFKPAFCYDDNTDNTPVIAGATGGSVGAVALGTGTGVLIAKFPHILIPSIKPLL